MVQLDEKLVDTLLQKLDSKLDEKLIPIQKRLENLEEGQRNLEEGQKRMEAKLNKEVEDITENISIIMVKMPDGEKIDKRLDRIEDELHFSPLT